MIAPETLKAIVRWSSDAGRQAALAAFPDGEPDEGGMGLWQSFQAAFPLEQFQGSDRDMAVTLYASVYADTARACFKALRGEW